MVNQETLGFLTGSIPRVAAVFKSEADIERAPEIARIATIGEVRVDQFRRRGRDTLIDHCAAVRRAGMKVLLTNRPKTEDPTSKWRGSEYARDVFISILGPYVDIADIEIRGAIAKKLIVAAEDLNLVIIGSAHSFDVPFTPEQTHTLNQRAILLGAHLTKLAMPLTSEERDQELRDLVVSDPRLIGVGMGLPGDADSIARAQRSRIDYAVAGSPIVYASADIRPLVPGQMSYVETHERLLEAHHGYAADFAVRMQ